MFNFIIIRAEDASRSIYIGFKSQDMLCGWRFGILGSALRDGNSAEMLRGEEQQESFVACLYYSVFNLLYGGGWVCSAGDALDQAEREHIFHSGCSGADWDPWVLVLFAFRCEHRKHAPTS